jgi:hypothetical protein
MLLLSPSRRILQDGFSFSRLDESTIERVLTRRSLQADSPGQRDDLPVVLMLVFAAALIAGASFVATRSRV